MTHTRAPADAPPFAPDRPRVTVAGTRYMLLGHLGRGDSSDVFLARRDARLTGRVVHKVVRALSDVDLVARGHEVLEALHRVDARGAEHFSRLPPSRWVQRGALRLRERAAPHLRVAPELLPRRCLEG